MFIAVDGIDGAGKTTLVKQLMKLLQPLNPITTKEPTDRSHWGQQLRHAALNGRLAREREIEYFHQDRLHHIEKLIRPTLDEGRPVITDRYVDSMLAFQTDTPEQAEELYQRLVSEIIVPDITFILNCPVSIGLGRIKRNRPHFTQYEKKNVLSRARRIYESREGDNYIHLDASKSPEHTLEQAVKALTARFRKIHRKWNDGDADIAKGIEQRYMALCG